MNICTTIFPTSAFPTPKPPHLEPIFCRALRLLQFRQLAFAPGLFFGLTHPETDHLSIEHHAG
jgi:hypothetical protein